MEEILEMLDGLPIHYELKYDLFKKSWNKEFIDSFTKDVTTHFNRILRKIPMDNIDKRSFNILIKAPNSSYKDELALNLVFWIRKLIKELDPTFKVEDFRYFFSFINFLESYAQSYENGEVQLEPYLLCFNVGLTGYRFDYLRQFQHFHMNRRRKPILYNFIFTTKKEHLPLDIFDMVIHLLGFNLETKIFYFLIYSRKNDLPTDLPMGMVKMKQIIPDPILKQFEEDKGNHMDDMMRSTRKRLEKLNLKVEKLC